MWLQPHSTSAQLQWLCHLPPAPTPNLSPRYFFLSLLQVQLHFLWSSTAARLLQISVGSAVCTHSSPLLPRSSVFPPLFSTFLSWISKKREREKKRKKKENKTEPSSGNLSPRMMIGVRANTSGKSSTAVMRCLAASCSLSSFSKNAVLLVSWVPGRQGGCSWRYIAVERQPKPGWSGRCK